MLEVLHQADGSGCYCVHCAVRLCTSMAPRFRPGELVVRYDNDPRSTWETTFGANRPTCGAWRVAA